MKHLILILSSLTALQADAAGLAGKYDIDPVHSGIGFEVPHMVISTVQGKFDQFSGSLNFSEKKTDTTFTADIDVASVDTGNPKRDEHLKSSDFFDAKTFPKITFVSKQVTVSGKKLTVKGDLTIHGITKSVTLVGTLLGPIQDPYGNSRIAASTSVKIKRQDFGLKWSKMIEAGPVVGDEVTITIKVEATQAQKKAS